MAILRSDKIVAGNFSKIEEIKFYWNTITKYQIDAIEMRAHRLIFPEELLETLEVNLTAVVLVQVLVHKHAAEFLPSTAACLALPFLLQQSEELDEARVEDGVRVEEDSLEAEHLLCPELVRVYERLELGVVVFIKAIAIVDVRVLETLVARQQREPLRGQHELVCHIQLYPVVHRAREVALEREALHLVDACEDIERAD